MKKYIGKLVIGDPDESETSEYLLDIYFKGLTMVNSNIIVNEKFAKGARPDLLLYNIVTLTTLTEFFNGPWSDNQDKLIRSDYVILIKLLKYVHCNILSSMYHFQESIVKFISSLHEGNNKTTITILEECTPVDLFSIIIRHLNSLYKRRETVERRTRDHLSKRNFSGCWKKSSKIGQVHPGEESSEDLLQTSEHYANIIMEKWYKIGSNFSEHPSITVARNIYFMMKSLASCNIGKFEPFLASKDKDINEKIYNRIDQTSDFKSMNTDPDKYRKEINHELRLFMFLKSVSLVVEILIQDEKNKSSISVEVNFPKIPEWFFLTNKSKLKFKDNCSIKDTNSKLTDLINFMPEFQGEMDYNRKIYQDYQILSKYTSPAFFTVYMLITEMLSFLINIYALCVISYPKKECDEDWNTFEIEAKHALALQVLVIVRLILSTVILALWFSFRYFESLAIERNKESKILLRIPWYSRIKNIVSKYFWKTFMQQWISVAIGLNIILGILYLTTKGNPIYLTLSLLIFMFKFQTTQYVITSITKHWIQLLNTFCLMLVMILIFSMLIMYYFNLDFNFGEDDPRQYEVCSNLYTWFLATIDLGLRNGGGIGDSMALLSSENNLFYFKFFIDMFFYFLINVIGINIVFGIIIDTFAELRDEQQSRQLDEQTICFIWGFSFKDFDKQEKSFKKHKENEHNIWGYVYFMIYLLKKRKVDFSGIEYYVNENFSVKKTDWYPIQKTMYLETENLEEIERINILIGEVGKNIEGIDSQYEEMKSNLNKLTKKIKEKEKLRKKNTMKGVKKLEKEVYINKELSKIEIVEVLPEEDPIEDEIKTLILKCLEDMKSYSEDDKKIKEKIDAPDEDRERKMIEINKNIKQIQDMNNMNYDS